MCDIANTYTWYATSIAGTNGVQPKDEALRAALDKTLQAATSLARTHSAVRQDAAKMVTFMRLYRQQWAKFDFDPTT